MPSDPIPTPALTPFELFEKLKAKGYQPRPCYQHNERGYCCAQAVADATDDFQDDPATACEVMKRYLELDRREVFRVWFGEIAVPGEEEALWQCSLAIADIQYAEGEIDTTIDFILRNPNP